MIIGLSVTWVFWSLIICFLIFWRRSWLPVILIPLALSCIWILVSFMSSFYAAFIAISIHVALLLYIMIKLYYNRKPDDDPFFSRDTKMK